MASYVVTKPASDRRGEDALFIRDAFAPLAVLVPVPWLLWHRLWFEAALALCASFAFATLSVWVGMPGLAGIVSILLGFYVALEGGALKIAASRRRGWEEAGIIDARNNEEAEERYYRSRPETRDEAPPATAPGLRRAAAASAGLFALPGAH